MVDFTGTPNPVLQAAYRRGIAESAARIATLEKDRQTVLMALVDALYDDEKREKIRRGLEEAYGLAEKHAIVVDL